MSYSVAAGITYKGRDYLVEGDASSASYFFAAAAILQKTVRVNGIAISSRQGDLRLLKIMEELGCGLNSGDDWIEVAGNGLLSGDFTFDLHDMPDMVPTLAVLAAFRRGQTTINNVAHLRLKESNRLAALACELNRMGIAARETADGLIVQGGSPQPARIETYNDHRIAMSFALPAWLCPASKLSIKNAWINPFPVFGRS